MMNSCGDFLWGEDWDGVDAGLLTREPRGKWAHYTIVQDAFTELRDFLNIG